MWGVIDAATASEAFNAPPTGGATAANPPIAKVNESHPDKGAVKCRSRSISRPGLNKWEVTAQYGVPPGGEWSAIDGADPINTKPAITWSDGKIAVPSDIDLNGYAFVNSAGDPFEPPPTRYIKVKSLMITRYEKGYDYNKYRPYEETVNASDITIGNVTFYAGEILCNSIQPSDTYNLEPTGILNIPIGYSFDIMRAYRKIGGQFKRVTHPWLMLQALKDQGTSGWASVGGTPKKGSLYLPHPTDTSKVGDKITSDILLDGKGKPIDTTLKVSLDGETPYDPVDAPSSARQWPDSYLAEYSTGQVKIINFAMAYAADFSQLSIFNITG